MYSSRPVFFLSTLKGLASKSTNCFISFFSSISLTSQVLNQKTVSINEFTKVFKFTEAQSSLFKKRLSRVRSPDTPLSVLNFLKDVGFSESQIISTVHGNPQILFSNVRKNLNPKFEYFRQLGFRGSDLGTLFSKHYVLLSVSLAKVTVPSVENLKKILSPNCDKEVLIQVLLRCGYMLRRRPGQCFLANAALLENCGVDKFQLSMLMRRQPRIFSAPEYVVRGLVSRAIEIGVAMNSRMLVHALYSLSCVSIETFSRKVELFSRFGFSHAEIMQIFARAPTLMRSSEEKLKFGLGLFLHGNKVDKALLVSSPSCLTYGMKKRVLPRYRVWCLIKAKKLQKKDPLLTSLMHVREDKFMQKYILKFEEDVDELLKAYNGDDYLNEASEEVS